MFLLSVWEEETCILVGRLLCIYNHQERATSLICRILALSLSLWLCEGIHYNAPDDHLLAK